MVKKCLLIGGFSDGDMVDITDKNVGDKFNVVITHEIDGQVANDIYLITNDKAEGMPDVLIARVTKNI